MLRSLPGNGVAWALFAALAGLADGASARADDTIRFNRDIRPILSENCFRCHGPDSASRKADLRLDKREVAIEMGAIEPGKPEDSGLVQRIFSTDTEEVMPPPSAHKELTAAQKDLLQRWVTAGAEYEPHWSFITPQRPAVPVVKNEAWPRTPIDRFILARLEAQGLQPAAAGRPAHAGPAGEPGSDRFAPHAGTSRAVRSRPGLGRL